VDRVLIDRLLCLQRHQRDADKPTSGADAASVVDGYPRGMVRISMLEDETSAEKQTALVLPGVNYTAQAPLLYWSTAVLVAAGWHVYAAEWEESDRDYKNPQQLIDRAFEVHADQSSGRVDLVVAKSLGTLALPRCVDEGIAGVWLTPLLNKTEILNALLSADRRHLAIGGTKDRHWLPASVQRTQATLLSIDDVDHALLHVDWQESMRIHSGVAARIARHVEQL
jgi:hypothetical protein